MPRLTIVSKFARIGCRQSALQLPVQIAAHYAFHLIDLAEGEHAWRDDAPALVRLGIIADAFRSVHGGGDYRLIDEESMARRTASSWEPSSEKLENATEACNFVR